MAEEGWAHEVGVDGEAACGAEEVLLVVPAVTVTCRDCLALPRATPRHLFRVDVSGAKYVDPETGFAYWWPDEEDSVPVEAPVLGEGWTDVGYTEDFAAVGPVGDGGPRAAGEDRPAGS